MDKQQLFEDIQQHLLEDSQPSLYLNSLRDEVLSQYPFNMLKDLKGVKQSPQHHPEGDVWNHTVLVVDQAALQRKRSKAPRAFMWAALLHDIGKPDTTRQKKGKITAYDHDLVGSKKARVFLQEFTGEEGFIQQVVSLVRWHMNLLFVVNELPFANVKQMKKDVDIHEIALLGYCDRMGRTGADPREIEETVALFLKKVEKLR